MIEELHDGMYLVQSFTDPEEDYLVSIDEGVCQCADWNRVCSPNIRKGTGRKTCKHIDLVNKYIQLTQQKDETTQQ
jgi:hypothetical protein